MNTKALATRSRKNDINTLIEKIRGKQFNMFESYVDIGINLNIIKEEKLFQPEGYKDFRAFLNDVDRHGFQFTPAEAWQCGRIAEVVTAIKEMRDKQPADIQELVPLPSSQSQIKPLMKLPDSRAGDTWISGAIHAHKVQTPLTNRFMADFVNHTEKIVEAAPVPETDGEGQETDRDFSKVAAETQASPFSAEALECLAKIENLQPHTFPEDARSSIEQDLITGVNNYSLELWNRHPTNEFKAIGRLVFFREMAFEKAQRFVMRPITQNSTIMDLVHAAVAFGGSFRIKVDNDRFVITIAETADQPATAAA